MTTANRTMTRNIIAIHLGVSRVLADEIVKKISDENCIAISSMKVGDIKGAIQDVIDGKSKAGESGDVDSKPKHEGVPSATSGSVDGLNPRFIDAGTDEDESD